MRAPVESATRTIIGRSKFTNRDEIPPLQVIGRPPHVKLRQHSRRLPERRCGSHSDHHRYATNRHATCTTETAYGP
eukprot:6451395-Prymnesium_polylepis.1